MPVSASDRKDAASATGTGRALFDSWNGVRVLVTGARGFLGSHVTEELVARGSTVAAFARQPPVSDGGIRWFAGDLTDRATVAAALREVRPDIVFHLAGQTVAAPEREWILPALRNNLVATVVLLHELAEVGCRRVVLTGSLEEPPIGQLDAVPASPYGASKWAEVVYARMFHALYQLPVTIVRLYMTYGPRQRPGKLIPYVILSLLRGQTPVIDQPDRAIDWIYIDDAVDGMLAAASACGLNGQTVELGSGALVSIREVAAELQDIIAGEVPIRMSVAKRRVGVDGRKADLAQTRNLLGWIPQTSLRKGLEQTVSWYRGEAGSPGDS